MGGRRGGSLTNLVGAGGPVTSAKGALTRAITKGEPNAIASASAKLLASSELGLEGLLYGLRITPYLEGNAERLGGLSRTDREEDIRAAWADIKKRTELQTTQEVDNVVVSAAINTLGKPRGPD